MPAPGCRPQDAGPRVTAPGCRPQDDGPRMPAPGCRPQDAGPVVARWRAPKKKSEAVPNRLDERLSSGCGLMSICMPTRMATHASVHTPVHISTHMSIPMSIRMPTHMSIPMSTHTRLHTCLRPRTHRSPVGMRRKKFEAARKRRDESWASGGMGTYQTQVWTHVYTSVYTHVCAHVYTHVYTNVCRHVHGTSIRMSPHMSAHKLRLQKPPPQPPVLGLPRQYWSRQNIGAGTMVVRAHIGAGYTHACPTPKPWRTQPSELIFASAEQKTKID